MTRRMARYALLTALAMVLSWLESMVPVSAAAPGVKLGLTNLVVIFALYRMGLRAAAAVSDSMRSTTASAFSGRGTLSLQGMIS